MPDQTQTKTCPDCGRKVDQRLMNCPGCGGRWHADGTFSSVPDVHRAVSAEQQGQTPNYISFRRRWIKYLIAVDGIGCLGIAIWLILRAL